MEGLNRRNFNSNKWLTTSVIVANIYADRLSTASWPARGQNQLASFLGLLKSFSYILVYRLRVVEFVSEQMQLKNLAYEHRYEKCS